MSKKQVKHKPKTVAISTDAIAFGKLKITLGIIIAAFAFLLYVQSVSFNYVMDDHLVTDKNELIKKGFTGIPTLLKTDYLKGFEDGVFSGPIYRPTSMVLFAIVWSFSPNNPHIFHLINVLLFSISCWLLYLMLCKLFQKQNLLFPFVCSLLYVAHPIHTEVVNNIKSLDEILCFLFGILSMYFAFKYLSSKSNVPLFIAAFSFLLSMLSKETGVTFLVIIPLTIFIFSDLSRTKFIKISFALCAVSIVYFIVRLQVLQSINPNTSNSYLYNSLVAAPNFISREATAFYILLKYILLLIVPYPLTCDYSFSQIKLQTITDLPAIAGVLGNLGLLVFALLNLHKKNTISYGILFYYITLSPVSNVVFLNGATMAERFMYLPSLGYCIILTYFFLKLIKTDSGKNKFQDFKQLFSLNSSMFLILSLILVFYSLKTISRSMDWKDNYSLFSYDAKVSDKSATVHYLYGNAILQDIYPNEKNINTKNQYIDTSILEFKKALTIFPNYAEPYMELGLIYARDKGQFELSLAYSDSAIKYYPNSQNAYLNKGSAFVNLKRYDEAISAYLKVTELNPKYADAYSNIGICNMNQGNYLAAISAFEKAIEISPKNTSAYCGLGGAYSNSKQYSKAIECLNKSLELDPTNVQSLQNLGITYRNIGDTLKAKEYFEKASRMSGGQGR